jgi:hypothetical protein
MLAAIVRSERQTDRNTDQTEMQTNRQTDGTQDRQIDTYSRLRGMQIEK